MTLTKEEYDRLYKNVLAKVDAMAVLEHYGADNIYQQNDEIIHSCLIDKVHPHHAHGDATPSASLNAENKLWNCWSYGGGDIVWLVQEMEGCDRLSALERLSAFIEDPMAETSQSLIEILKEKFKAEEPPASIPTYSEFILRPWKKIHPYLASRGISDATVISHKVGYDDEEDKIVFPHFWKGKLVGYQKRRLDSPWNSIPTKVSPKYKNSADFPRDSTLYNLDQVIASSSETVIVVESVMSVLRAETLGFVNVVATFGGKVTEEQIDCLKNFKKVILFMDNDASGWSGTVKLYNGLKDSCTVMIVEAPEGKDMGDSESLQDLEDMLSTQKFGPLVIGKFLQRVEGFKNGKVRQNSSKRNR
jgi:DNA primase